MALDGQEEQEGDASSDEASEGELEVEHSGLDLGWLQKLGGHSALLSDEGRDDAVTDSVRENVRPLVYRLVGNAERLSGGGSGASEVFNGF